MTPKRILLVDDDLLGSSLTREVLKSEGYEVAAVISGEKALARLEAEPAPDLILMDIDLGPGRMDGTEAARRITERADVPIVFLSAHSDAETITRARSAAKYGFVHKVPGHEMFLLATVELALELHQTEARRRAERSLRGSESRLATLMGNVPGILYRCRNDRDWTMEFLSEGCLDLTGYEPAELLGNAGFAYGTLILPEDRDKVWAVVQTALAEGKDFRLVYRIRKKAGDIRWVSERGRGIAAPDGSTAAVEGIILDITDRRKADELVEKGLQEKTILLKELQHRVKNNLTVISSLLNLESERLYDPRDREIFRMMRNRIRSMALIYERLYRSDDVRAVDAQAYLEGLAKQLFESNQVRPGQIRLGLRFESFPLDLRKAVSCGLIFTELIANAMKHAFPGGRKGSLEISALRSGEGFVLAVRDDGVGFDVPAMGRESDGFGLKLVRSQVEQMDGKLKIEAHPGALFEIEVPIL